jgi:uncharacterized protein (DUF2249 family)
MAVLDVRDLMAKGGDPFAVIMAAVSQLGPTEPLDLIAPLDPIPLYAVLGARGYAHLTEDLGDGDYRVRFTRTPGPTDG